MTYIAPKSNGKVKKTSPAMRQSSQTMIAPTASMLNSPLPREAAKPANATDASGSKIRTSAILTTASARLFVHRMRLELLAYLRGTLKPGDVCLALSAGDLTAVTHELLNDAPAALAG